MSSNVKDEDDTKKWYDAGMDMFDWKKYEDDTKKWYSDGMNMFDWNKYERESNNGTSTRETYHLPPLSS